MKTSPLAVAIDPPLLGRPVFCLSGGRRSVTPRFTRHANSPVLTLTAVNMPHGGCWHIMFIAVSLNRPPPGTASYGLSPLRVPVCPSAARSLKPCICPSSLVLMNKYPRSGLNDAPPQLGPPC